MPSKFYKCVEDIAKTTAATTDRTKSKSEKSGPRASRRSAWTLPPSGEGTHSPRASLATRRSAAAEERAARRTILFEAASKAILAPSPRSTSRRARFEALSARPALLRGAADASCENCRAQHERERALS